MSIEIDARENGIHSLAEALRAFKKYHDDHTDKFALKDAIIRSNHALEALFKNILYKINPVLLLQEDSKIKDVVKAFQNLSQDQIEPVLDNERTIGLDEAVSRLHNFGLIKGVDEKGYDIFIDGAKKLTDFRNKLQHFKLKVDPDSVARILGLVLPRGIMIIEATYAHISFKYAVQIFGLQPISVDLKKIYPEWESVYDILVNEYDQLIQDAIKALKKQTFKDLVLNLKIEDYGKIGAPPYFANLKATGFLVFEKEPHMMWTQNEEMGFPYSTAVTITEPTFAETEPIINRGIAEGTFEMKATVYVDASKALKLPSIEKELSVLRVLKTIIDISLKYKAEAMKSNWSYDVQKILEVSGQLRMTIEILPMGSEQYKDELIGKFQMELNESNAPFRFNAFLNPDKTLRDSNYHLDWNINAKGDLVLN